MILPILTTSHCETGFTDIGVQVDQDGLIEVFIEVNPNPGADPQDVTLTASVFAHPGGNGYNTILWNGKNGQGIQVRNGTLVTATIRFIHGITHLPLYDIEFNDNGYKVEVVRPPGISPPIYWDDSLIPYGSTVNLGGCIDPLGCHLWDSDAGDTNTINSWWYVANATAPAVTFNVKRTPANPGKISGEPGHCSGIDTKNYTIVPDSNATAYTWNYTGTGTTLTGTGPGISLDFSSGASSGMLSVAGSNAECGTGPASSLPITIFPIPVVTVNGFDSVCFNSPAIQLSGGLPPGGEYVIDGAAEVDFDPFRAGQGSHILTYTYTDVHGCFDSDTTVVIVKNGSECETVMWVPNAFTPDNDGVNDTFKPYAKNIWAFTMNIYSRSGELVFTSALPDIGWDGMYHNSQCPPGNYVYVIVYQSSRASMQNQTLTGNVILMR
jgi:gliding motility-associated-like protein